MGCPPLHCVWAMCEPVRFELQDAYRRLKADQYCLDCGQFHDKKDYMHYSVAVTDRVFMYGYYCVECGTLPEQDRPGGVPPKSRVWMEGIRKRPMKSTKELRRVRDELISRARNLHGLQEYDAHSLFHPPLRGRWSLKRTRMDLVLYARMMKRLTFREIGWIFNFSVQRARQLHKRAVDIND